MGKGKSKTKLIVRKKDMKLAKSFQCLFCQHDGSVTVTFQNTTDGRLARLACKMCDAKFGLPVSKIAHDVDVYSAWVDSCEEAAELNGR
jgi:transcription elongation factor Elf1